MGPKKETIKLNIPHKILAELYPQSDDSNLKTKFNKDQPKNKKIKVQNRDKALLNESKPKETNANISKVSLKNIEAQDERKFKKKFVNRQASRRELRKSRRQKNIPLTHLKAELKKKLNDKKRSEIESEKILTAKQIKKESTKTNFKKEKQEGRANKKSKVQSDDWDPKEEEEEKYLKYFESKLKIKDPNSLLKSKEFIEDGLDELLEGIALGSNKFRSKNSNGNSKRKAIDKEVSEGDSCSDLSEHDDTIEKEKLIEGAHYYSTREPTVPSNTEPLPNRYIPPHLRKSDDKLVQLRRLMQGIINKLGETNIEPSLSLIEGLYQDYTRNSVTTTFAELILLSVSNRPHLLDSFVLVNAALVAAVYRTIGTEPVAHFVQSLVEKLLEQHKLASSQEVEMANKICLNLVTLVAELYNMKVVSCVLIYSLIRFFLENLNMLNVELLLKLIRSIGHALRQDDPTAMKDIILMANRAASNSEALGLRFKFMLETLNEIKNNRTKPTSIGEETIKKIKAMLQNIDKRRRGGNTEPLQVSLQDILDAPIKGKWWVVGAAWKGTEETLSLRTEDDGSQSLLKLAREQSMSTDVRKGIFTALMSSEDFADAIDRLNKLKLSEKQSREIPRVLVHCCGNEKTYNPFYSLVALKMSSMVNGMKLTLQFILWDFLRELGEETVGALGGSTATVPVNDRVPIRKVLHLSKFYGFLLAKGSLNLSILKSLTFTSLKARTRILLQLMLSNMLIQANPPTEILAGHVTKLAELEDVKYGLNFFIHHFLSTEEHLNSLALNKEEVKIVLDHSKFLGDLLKL